MGYVNGNTHWKKLVKTPFPVRRVKNGLDQSLTCGSSTQNKLKFRHWDCVTKYDITRTYHI